MNRIHLLVKNSFDIIYDTEVFHVTDDLNNIYYYAEPEDFNKSKVPTYYSSNVLKNNIAELNRNGYFDSHVIIGHNNFEYPMITEKQDGTLFQYYGYNIPYIKERIHSIEEVVCDIIVEGILEGTTKLCFDTIVLEGKEYIILKGCSIN